MGVKSMAMSSPARPERLPISGRSERKRNEPRVRASEPERSPDVAPQPPTNGSSAKALPQNGGKRDPDVAVALNSAALRASNKLARQAEAEEDRALIERAKTGDRPAFRELVERHQRRAFAIALGLVRDENDAKEIVQEAFLRVYRGLDAFNGQSSFFTWLYRIVTNLSIDLMRKPARRDAEFDDGREIKDELDIPLLARIDGADPQDVVRRGEIRIRIQSALDALPPYHRGVILMREIEGMSYEEMAQAMGVSKGTIMSRLFHARQKLQRALSDCYEEQVGAHPPSEKAGT
jgi:RNA polymerase sigma-70 factor, ECF subfamily